jgi:hypothetical protein
MSYAIPADNRGAGGMFRLIFAIMVQVKDKTPQRARRRAA